MFDKVGAAPDLYLEDIPYPSIKKSTSGLFPEGKVIPFCVLTMFNIRAAPSISPKSFPIVLRSAAPSTAILSLTLSPYFIFSLNEIFSVNEAIVNGESKCVFGVCSKTNSYISVKNVFKKTLDLPYFASITECTLALSVLDVKS